MATGIKKITAIITLSVFIVLSFVSPSFANTLTEKTYDFNSETVIPSYITYNTRHLEENNTIKLVENESNCIWYHNWSSSAILYVENAFEGMDLEKGDKVTISYKAKEDEASDASNSKMGLTVYSGTSSSRAVLGKIEDADRIAISKTGWTDITYEFTVGDTLPTQVGINSITSNLKVYVDDLKIKITKSQTVLLTNKVYNFNDGDTTNISFKNLVLNTDAKVDSDTFNGDSGKSIWLSYWASYCRMYVKNVFADMDIDSDSKVKLSYMAKIEDSSTYTEGKMGVSLIDSNNTEIFYQPSDARNTVKKGEWSLVSYEFSIDDTIPVGIGIIGDSSASATRFSVNIDDLTIEISEDTGSVTPPDEGGDEGEGGDGGDTPTPPDGTSSETSFSKVFNFNDGITSFLEFKNLSLNGKDAAIDSDTFNGDSGKSLWASFWASYCRVYIKNAFDAMNLKQGTKLKISLLAKIEDSSTYTEGEMGVSLVDASNNELLYQPADKRSTVKKGEWLEVSYEFEIDDTIPNGIGIIPDGASTGDVRFGVNIDDVIIEKIVDETNVIKIEKKNNKINFSGILEEESASLPLVLYVIKEGYEANDFSTEAVFAKFDVTSDENASYTYEALSFDTENYKTNFTLTLDGVKGYKNSYVTKAYVYENDNFVKNLLIGLSNATGVDFIKTTLENSENKEILKISDIEILNDAKFTGNDALYTYLLNNKAKIYDEQNPYSTDNLISLIKSGAVLSELGKESVSHLAAYIDKYATELGILDLTAYKTTYKNANNKETLVSYLKGGYESASDFANAFEEKVINGAIKSASVYTDVIKIAEDNKTYLGLDFSDVNALNENNKFSVQTEFATYLKSVSSYDNLQNRLNLIVANYSDSSYGKGSASGGGGGSSSSKVYSMPAPLEVENMGTSTLSDISDHWGKEYIDKLIQNGAVSGYVDNTFRPDNTITRAEFAKMLYFVMGIKDTSKNSGFEDIPQDDWSYPYVSYLYENGVIMGMSDALFGKNNPITRQDMAVIIARILDKEYTKKDAGFNDYDLISDYALDAVDKVFALGIMTGDGQNFNPLGLATRAEAAKVLCSLIS